MTSFLVVSCRHTTLSSHHGFELFVEHCHRLLSATRVETEATMETGRVFLREPCVAPAGTVRKVAAYAPK